MPRPARTVVRRRTKTRIVIDFLIVASAFRAVSISMVVFVFIVVSFEV
jgi:hypothetical protein